MKLVKIMIVLLFVLLVLVSCKPKTERPTEDYRYGTEGLRLTFMQNQPPSSVWDEDSLNIVLEVANRGADNAGHVDDKIFLSGFDPSIVTGISIYGAQIPPLEGKSTFNQYGTVDYIEFTGILRDLSTRNIDKYPFRLFATACYNYKTIASSNVCIDPDPFSPSTKEKVCIPQDINLGSQGAPIAVDKIEVDAAPHRTRFKIHISNVGGGDVFKESLGYLLKCSPYDPVGLGFNEIDYVKLNKVEVSGVNLLSSCKPLSGNYLRLVDGKGFIMCEFSSPQGNAAYVTPLVTELEYGYRNSISKSIEIRSSG